ncbi:THC0290_0291 family protein [Aequorivita sediminis]|uniref:THC0290_0291 family protein n=1 Tax=Aequorivita sediminis TaxID=3073653 RepID=UPI0028ACE369|nr:glutamate dehydrogenase [Aequorivita sp. F6058]
MNIRTWLLVISFLGLFQQAVYGQFGFSNEVGIIAGPVAFYSDFGQRHDFETNSGNIGFGVGIVHYLNFAYRGDFNIYTRYTYFNDHFKVRSELDYHVTKLQHYGEWVAPDKTSLFADQLRAMSGEVTVLDIGTRLEYYPLSIRAFQANGYKLMPYIGLGIHWVHYKPEVRSSLGDLNSPITTPVKYFNAFQQQAGSTFSVVGSVGVRYKIGQFSDIMLDSRWQQYFTDWADGLNPTLENNGERPVPENKSNDWIYWLNVGYIYYIN